MFIFNIGHHVYPANWNFYAIEKFRWTPIEVGLSMGFVGLLAAIVQGGLIRVVIQIRRRALCSFQAILRRHRLFRHRLRRLNYERLFMVFGIRICRTFRASNYQHHV